MQKKNMKRKSASRIIILEFLVLVFGFTIATVLHRPRAYSERENKTLSQKPAMRLEALLSGEYEKDYENYLTDQFFLRDQWISLKTSVERFLGRKDINHVYFAKDHYLIESHAGTFDTDRAQANVQQLSVFMNSLCTEYDLQHLTAAVVPNAVDILRDKLPAFAAPYNEEIYLNEISSSLPEGVFLDTSSVLRPHSKEEIYYRTDHHWKTLGAFYTFQAWAQKAGLGTVDSEDYIVKTVTDDFSGTVAAKVGNDSIRDSIQTYARSSRPDLSQTIRAAGASELPESSQGQPGLVLAGPLAADFSGNNQDQPLTIRMQINQSGEIFDTLYDEEKLSTHDKYGYFLSGNYGLTEVTTDAGSGRRILVIKDSYAHCFIPFLTDYFDEIDIVDLRYFTQSLHKYMEQGNYTDVLFLYNAAGFAEDANLQKLGT